MEEGLTKSLFAQSHKTENGKTIHFIIKMDHLQSLSKEL